jgi:photosystem II stability/assembly factor-like uncharacterized protein
MVRTLFLLTLSLQGFLFAQWVQVPSPAPYELYDLTNLYFINDSVGFAGYENSSIVTYDRGRSWNMNPGFTDLVKACYVDSLNGFGITETNFYQTADGGVNWVSITDSLEITRFSLLECVNGKVFVVGNKTVRGDGYWYASDDIGTSWELRHQQDSTMYFQGRFLDDENIFGFAASRILNDPTEIMYHYVKTTDGGYNWQSIDFPAVFTTGNQFYFIFCPDLDSCYTAASFFGFGLQTFQYNINHLDFSTGIQDTLLHQTQNAVNFIEGFDESLIIGGGGFIKVSPDRGLNWYSQNISFLSNPQTGFLASHVFNDSSAIITGSVGSIIRTDNFGLGLKEANSPQPSFSVYPNPSTKGYQEITLAGITPHTTCTIELFDLHGKQVKQVFSGRVENSELKCRVDLNHLAAGSYVYRVQTEMGVRQKKVVVY